jgi:ribonuclease P protein component
MLMQTFRKSERLCNFNLKKLLFEKGNSFFCYPFKIQWYIISNPVENYILEEKPQQYSCETIISPIREEQNPSYPHRAIPDNSLFRYPVKCLISVPTRKFKNASDRNYIKRLIKESYRKNKSGIYSFFTEKGINCLLGIIYTGKTIPDNTEIEKKIILSLQELEKAVASTI